MDSQGLRGIFQEMEDKITGKMGSLRGKKNTCGGGENERNEEFGSVFL